MSGMTVEEIYVLNSALDGEDIFGLSSFSEIGASKMMFGSVNEQLIRKELLETESSLTMQGVQMVKTLDDYKKSKKYLKLGTLIIGLSEDDVAVALISSGDPVEYEFQYVSMEDGYDHICKVYPFLSMKPGGISEREIDYEELIKEQAVSPENILKLSTYSGRGKEETAEVFFSADDKLYLYNEMTKLLEEPFFETMKVIQERMALQ